MSIKPSTSSVSSYGLPLSNAATKAKDAANVFVEWRERYVNNSVRFVEEVKGKKIQTWQGEALEQYDHRQPGISIRSGHGVGKSTCLAWMMEHHILTRYPQKTVVTAPTEKQLFDALWAEFRTSVETLPPHLRTLLEMKSDRCELVASPAGSFCSAKTARAEQPDALQGVHSDWVLLIVDEAAGVAEQVFEAAMGSMSGFQAVTVLAGNPTIGSGFFYDTHNRLADLWWTRKVPCAESPFVDPKYIERVGLQYGTQSNVFRVRVLGEFPTTEDDTVIPRHLVDAAIAREVLPSKTMPVVWGVDVAAKGDDRSTLAKRQGNLLVEPIKCWTKLDTMELSAKIKTEYDLTPQWMRPTEINVDSINIGRGVADRLAQLKLPARGVNVWETPASSRNAERFANLRAELWFTMGEWFAKRDCGLPKVYGAPEEGRDLVEELCATRYEYQPRSQRIVIEDKKKTKGRLGHSPDMADAFMLTFASDAITLLHGRTSNVHSGKISRPLRGLV